MTSDTLSQLVTLSNHLGRPELDYAILGEGNTSARADDASFWVKTSGHELRTIAANGFVRVAFDGVLDLLDCGDVSDEMCKGRLAGARMDPLATGHPSVETLLHALCLKLPGVSFAGHTHPIAVNSLTCSANFESAFEGRLFPDEIVVCGPAPLLVPYTDPGIPLARKIKELVDGYLQRYGQSPKWILMQNHGLIALGGNPQQVENVTAMAVKTCRVLLGTFAAGGPRFLSEKDAQRIHTRPDELRRQQHLKLDQF